MRKIFIFSLILLIGSFSFYYFSPDKNTSAEKIKKPAGEITKKSPSSILKKISSVKDFFVLNDFKTDKLNILALGRPGAGHPGENLTDTIIVFHFGPDQKLTIISLPRDLLVKIPGNNNYTKINQLYELGGLETIRQKTEEITGLSIDRYVLVDLTVVKETVDFVDGVNVLVPQDIYDPLFPGPNYSYEAFVLKAGWRYLDGETALKYIRTRHSKQGDFDRMTRQQQILLALKRKVLSFNPLFDLPVYLKIFQSLNEHIQTDLTLMEIKSLWQMGQKIELSQIINLTIDKERTNLLTSGPIILNGQTASMVWPKRGQEDYSEIKNFIANNLEFSSP